MINVTEHELEAILSTVAKALDMHGQWRERLQRTLICKLPPSDADVADDAHHQCAFGHWFYSSGNAHLRKLPIFKRIEAHHTAMHNLARELLTRVNVHWIVTPDEYDLFTAQEADFRKELLNLRHKVKETLHKIDPLTGAIVSSQLLPDLHGEQVARCGSGQPRSLLLLLRFDLAQINRSDGIKAGDAALQSSIHGIRQSLGPEEKIYRYSGAEFAISLPGKTQDDAVLLKEGLLVVIRQALESMPELSAATLNVQWGIVELKPDAPIEQSIHGADLTTHEIRINPEAEPEPPSEPPSEPDPSA